MYGKLVIWDRKMRPLLISEVLKFGEIYILSECSYTKRETADANDHNI